MIERTGPDEWLVEFDDGGQAWRDHHELRPRPEAENAEPEAAECPESRDGRHFLLADDNAEPNRRRRSDPSIAARPPQRLWGRPRQAMGLSRPTPAGRLIPPNSLLTSRAWRPGAHVTRASIRTEGIGP